MREMPGFALSSDEVNPVIELAIAKDRGSVVEIMLMAETSGEMLVVGKLLVKLHVELQRLGERVGIGAEIVGAVGIA